MVIVLDCETIDRVYNAISDISWAIVERNKIKEIKAFVPRETIAEQSKGEFSAPKLFATMQEVANGNATVKSWIDICAEMLEDFNKATRIYAYNAPFDRGAIIRTGQILGIEGTVSPFENEKIFNKWRDLWAWAANTILYKKSFIDFCTANNLLTEKGNISTSAETCLKFIRKDLNYEEKHTARADVLDEIEIYLTIKKEVKKDYNETAQDYDAQCNTSPYLRIKKLRTAINS